MNSSNGQQQIKPQPITKTIKKKPRVVHLSQDLYDDKIKNLEAQIATGTQNKAKRKRIYHELAQLKKNCVLVDPQIKEQHKQIDSERRIQKKIEKKQQIVESVHKEKEKIKMKEKDKVCLMCKKVGHTAQHCRENPQQLNQTICYNCGSKKHTLKDCQKSKSNQLAFAVCFVCKKSGHISRDCPDNPKGLYAYGGGCYICGSAQHTQANCPKHPKNRIRQQLNQQQQENYLSD